MSGVVGARASRPWRAERHDRPGPRSGGRLRCGTGVGAPGTGPASASRRQRTAPRPTEQALSDDTDDQGRPDEVDQPGAGRPRAGRRDLASAGGMLARVRGPTDHPTMDTTDRPASAIARSSVAGERRATASIESRVIGSSTSWTWSMPSPAKARSVVGELGRLAARPAGIGALRGVALEPARRRRAGGPGRRPSARPRPGRGRPRGTPRRPGRGAARRPSGRLPVSSYQAFHESAWAIVDRGASAARSSRSSAAGRSGAARAAAARSRGPGTSARRSRWRPRGGASG